MRTQNYIKTVPQYLKIAAIALVAIYVVQISTVDSIWWAYGCPKHVEQLLEEK